MPTLLFDLGIAVSTMCPNDTESLVMPHKLSLKAEPVIAVLKSEGFQSCADDLRSAADAGEGDRVAQMCHPKWLGDLYIKSKEWPEWWNMLSELRRHARRFSKQEPSSSGAA
ncbi:MAG: hypothetical protein AAF809_03150 [Bacteroidota bacterium]